MADSISPTRPRFLVDLGSPFAYLAAERIDEVLPDAEWQVVLLGGIFRATGRDSWANGAARADGRAEIERRALQRGLPPIRWPEPWPSDGLLAARVATWADLRRPHNTGTTTDAAADGHIDGSGDATGFTDAAARRSNGSGDPTGAGAVHSAPDRLHGVGRAFIAHALRLHFAEGRTLSDPANVAEAAARAGLDPVAALAAAATDEVKHELRARTDAAVAAGVFGVPAVLVDQFVCWGDDQLEQAAILARHRNATITSTVGSPA